MPRDPAVANICVLRVWTFALSHVVQPRFLHHVMRRRTDRWCGTTRWSSYTNINLPSRRLVGPAPRLYSCIDPGNPWPWGPDALMRSRERAQRWLGHSAFSTLKGKSNPPTLSTPAKIIPVPRRVHGASPWLCRIECRPVVKTCRACGARCVPSRQGSRPGMAPMAATV